MFKKRGLWEAKQIMDFETLKKFLDEENENLSTCKYILITNGTDGEKLL